MFKGFINFLNSRGRKEFFYERPQKFSYITERSGIKFHFFSDLDLGNADFSHASDIILSNYTLSVNGDVTAAKLYDYFHEINEEINSVRFCIVDRGKTWIIKFE